ncbi:blast:Mediator of RNA polymerase II transcription subunit 20 [Drosophila guanche]|uniref:Mediator of RNA polymerase II transcription subunit 20 n=1 Tax=Drosophila guanche TaxID=7266 RepID=A0A3B0JXL5_DROGU|nr:blast:Mediator of RNA polymerase II transcription subunit 20 [Drosophila guanche]
MMEHFKGISIEIEYNSCMILSYCWEMIREILQGHGPAADMYEPTDTVKRYLEQFTNYRKHVSMHGSISGGIQGALGGQQQQQQPVHMSLSPEMGAAGGLGMNRP